MIVFTLRITMTVLLLVIVWLNAHWSVALVLSLLCAANEITSAVIQRMR